MLSFYILLYLFCNIGDVPYFSLGAELTYDYHERVKLIAVREVCALTGLLLATAAPAFLICKFEGGDGYSIMGAVLGCGAALILTISGSVVKERPEFRGREKMRPFESWIKTFDNKHFRRLLLAFFFNGIGAAVPAVLVIYVSIYIIGTPTWWSQMMPGWWPTWAFYLQLYMFAGICSIPFWNYLPQSHVTGQLHVMPFVFLSWFPPCTSLCTRHTPTPYPPVKQRRLDDQVDRARVAGLLTQLFRRLTSILCDELRNRPELRRQLLLLHFYVIFYVIGLIIRNLI